LAIPLRLFLLSLPEHLIERLLVLDHCWVSDYLIQLKVPAAAVLNPHLKTTIRHEAVLTGFPSLE
jgi:hypothetical protein